jgi:hypothetical protein
VDFFILINNPRSIKAGKDIPWQNRFSRGGPGWNRYWATACFFEKLARLFYEEGMMGI